MPLTTTILPSSIGTGLLTPGQPGAIGGPGGPNSPYAGSGWEVTVLAAPSYYQQLAKLPPKLVETVQFVKQLNDKGSGSITLTLDDPFWQVNLPGNLAAHDLLDYEHLWQVWQDGILRFEFFGETVTETLIDPSEGRTVVITGPGTIASLGWAMAAPPGFPNIIYKLDAITDGFSEVNTSGQLVVDYGLWNQSAPQSHISLNPSGTMQVMASPSTTFLGTNVFDGTETLISAQVQPLVSPDPAGNTLNNSQVTQFYIQSVANTSNYFLIGMTSTSLYAKLGDPTGVQTQVIATASAYATAQSNNQPYSYWQISEHAGYFYAWTSADGQTWAQRWKVAHTWNASQVGFYFSAAYSVDNAEYATMTSLNSDVTTSSLAGAIYQNQPIMSVWLQELYAAQNRGTIPFIATRMNASYDSFGNAWTDSQSVQIQNGTDLYSLLQGHCSMINADFVMQPGFLLTVGTPQSGNITLGADRSHQIVFREARGETSKTRTRTRNQIANLIAAINQDGRTVTALNSTSESNWGQREGWIQAAVQINPTDLDIAAAAAVENTSQEVLAWTLQIIPNMPGQTVFRDFDVGDWIGLERPDYSAIDVVRVIAIAVQYDDVGIETHELTLVSYLQWLQEQLTYVTQKLGGNLLSVNGTTPVAGGISSLVQPSVFAPTLAGLSDVIASSTPTGAPLVWDPVTGKWVPAGTVNPDTGSTAPVQVSSSAGTTVVAPTGTTVTSQVGTAATTGDMAAATPVASTVTVPAGVAIYDVNGTQRVVVGQQQDGSYTHQTVNAPPPQPPDTPSVSAGALGVIVGWDGLLAAAQPLMDFQYVQVHGSTITGFTPGTPTLQGVMPTGGLFGIGGLAAGTPYYVKLVAVSKSGSTSVPSTQASATPASVGSTIAAGTLNGNVITTGTITSTQISATAGIMGSQLAANAGIVAGQVAFTAAQIGGGPAVTVSATAPSSPHNGDLWFNGSASYLLEEYNGTTWVPYQFGTQAIAAGSVTAALIAANTITAAQIAAGTITASQIAAGTITATQIASGTITAAELGAGIVYAGIVDATTITGAQLVATGTAGEFLCYDGTPGLGNLIGSWSGSAGTDQYGNNYPAGLDVTTGSITGTIFSGLNFELTTSGLFFYTSAPTIALVQAPAAAGNLNASASGNPMQYSLGPLGSTVRGNTVFMVILTYTTGLQGGGVSAAKLTPSNAAMTKIASVPYNSTAGSAPIVAVGWLDVWASYNTPGSDTAIMVTLPVLASQPQAYLRQFFEFSGLGTSPQIDVTLSQWVTTTTSTTFTTGPGVNSSTAVELWLGGVAAYYNPSATPPTITGPASPWINQPQIGGQIDSYTSSLEMMTGYQIMAATGSVNYAGSFSLPENYGCFALAIQPSTPTGAVGGLALSVAGVAGADTNGNQFPIGYMGRVQAIQLNSSPTLPESWHTLTPLPTGLSGIFRYKLVAEGSFVAIDISVAFPSTATTYSFPALPAGYQPSAPGSQPRIYANQGNAGSTAVGQIPRFYYSSGAFQLIVSGGGAGTASLTLMLPMN